MKRYLSVLILLVFVVPVTTFASWWNPLSWFKTSKVETPREEIVNENSIKPAEAKKTLQPVTKSVIPQKTKAPSCDQKCIDELVNKKYQQEEIKRKQMTIKAEDARIVEEINTRVISQQIDSFKPIAKIALEYLALFDSRTDYINNLKTISRSFSDSSDEFVRKVGGILNKMNDNDLERIQFYRKQMVRHIDDINNRVIPNLSRLLEPETRRIQPDVSMKDGRENISKLLDGINGIYKLVSEERDTIISNYNTYVKKSDALNEEIYTDVRIKLESVRESYSSSYAPREVYIPTIEIPKFPKTTYCNAYGTGVNGGYNMTCNQY